MEMERMIVQHLHTKDSGKKPSPDIIMDGELAINYLANGETLFIKNSEGAIAEFKDDKYYQKQLSEKTDKTLSLTYSELVSLRDNSQLIPGQQYRITDYQCTTIQENTRSAGHQFDIIVKADSENKLNEEANAIQHTKDDIDYFANSDLSAWKIWYSLDNDTTRFAWADSTNGKGVIYRMIDEWNNDVPYDFKNIQYNGSWGYWAYTFNWQNDASDNSCEDLSVAQYAHTNDEGGYSHTYGNVIKPCELGDTNYGVPFKLNACVFLNTETYDGGLFYGCNNNTFGNNCQDNVFGNDCDNNVFGDICYSNVFGNVCYNNVFGNGCYNNTFGTDCYNNIFGTDCYNNIFGTDCYNNALGNSCYSNTLGDNCDSNAFGNNCQDNVFGNNCGSNAFGNRCNSNVFGNSCNSNVFGNICHNNVFGNNCQDNVFGNDCDFIIFASDRTTATKYNYYQQNHFGDGCQYIVFTGAGTASNAQQVQNYNFAQGLQGTDSAYLTIDGKRNRTYETYISKDTDGTIKESVIADTATKKYVDTELGRCAKLDEENYFTKNIVMQPTNAGEPNSLVFKYEEYTGMRIDAGAITIPYIDGYIVFQGDSSATPDVWAHYVQGRIELATEESKEPRLYGIASPIEDLDAANKKYVDDTIKANIATHITYSELKSLRDAGKLVPGTQYRITDYTCTTTQANTKSAGHVFDIIVTADDERTLNEVAKAVKHEGDAYFANSDLNAWKIWYCFDNDTDRFAWADETNGKGVIYRMIDEFNNDIPYDFKNIQFYRKWDSGKSLWSTISSDNTGVPCYTFSSKGNSSTTSFTDMSLVASNNIYSNVIGKYVSSNKQTLNNICFFGNYCVRNTFGNYCYSNTFGDYCSRNTFGNDCYSNTFGNSFQANTFGNNCSRNIFGNNCYYNTFGNSCGSNTFGNNCWYNIFGNNCSYNTFGNYCQYNTFGNGCIYIKFASDSSASTKYNYYQYNHFGDGCAYLVFKGTETASSTQQVQNYNFSQGLQGTGNAYLTIDGIRNLSYETKVAKNSNGEIKIYCEADLIL